MAAEVVDLNHRPMPSKRRLKRMRDDLVRFLAQLDDEAVDDLWRRLSEPTGHDGFSAGGDGNGRLPPQEAKPTEDLAVRKAHPKYRAPADPLLACGQRIVKHMTRAHDEMLEANRVRQVILAAADGMRGRQSAIQVCDVDPTHICTGSKSDRLRTGLCWNCYEAWSRWLSAHQEHDRRNPASRDAFIEWQRGEIEKRRQAENTRARVTTGKTGRRGATLAADRGGNGHVPVTEEASG